jgi:hypothetical protein
MRVKLAMDETQYQRCLQASCASLSLKLYLSQVYCAHIIKPYPDVKPNVANCTFCMKAQWIPGRGCGFGDSDTLSFDRLQCHRFDLAFKSYGVNTTSRALQTKNDRCWHIDAAVERTYQMHSLWRFIQLLQVQKEGTRRHRVDLSDIEWHQNARAEVLGAEISNICLSSSTVERRASSRSKM